MGGGFLLLAFLDSRNLTIKLTPDGFSPAEVTIKTGETVTFYNFTKTPFWPASNEHPSHSIYSEFDSKKPIATGETWSFQFNKPGVWKYHDHLSPFFTGFVIVEGQAAQDATAIDYCAIQKDSSDCWRQELDTVFTSKGIEPTFDLLESHYQKYPLFADSCHNLAHELGHQSVNKYLEDPDSIFSPKAAYCAYGFYHGFMESLINARGIVAAKNFCREVGARLGESTPDAFLQCYHGVGHGGIALTAGEHADYTEDGLTQAALEFCELASDAADQLYRCASGVFNTVGSFYIRNEFGLRVRPEDPLWFCHIQPDKYKDSCYGNLNLALNWAADNDFSKSSKFVEKIPEQKYAASAMIYLAASNSLRVAKNDPEAAVFACRNLKNQLNLPCIEGFVYGFLENGSPNFAYREAMAFCDTKSMTEDEREKCFDYSLSPLDAIYSIDKARQICAEEAPLRYKKYCEHI